MDWLNIHTSTLDSPEFLGADPVQRATWLCLMRYCAGQENGGTIRDCLDWGDRKWQQLCRVMLHEVKSKCDLWLWNGRDLTVNAYPVDKEKQVVQGRKYALAGAMARWGKDAGGISEGNAGGIPVAIDKGNAEGEGKGKGREGGGSQPPTIPFNKGKIRTRDVLAEFGIPNGSDDAKEWAGGLNRIAKCRSVDETRMFIRWAIDECRRQGVIIEHWRHVRQLAIEWNNGQRENHWQEPAPAEATS